MFPNKSDEPVIVLEKSQLTHGTYFAALAGWVGLIGVFIFASRDWWKSYPNAAPVMTAVAAVFGGTGLIYITVLYLTRVMLRAEFRESGLQVDTVLGHHSIPWSEIGRVSYRGHDNAWPLLRVVRADGRRLEIWLEKHQAERVVEFLRGRTYASNWPGVPATFWTNLALLYAGLAFAALAVAGLKAAQDPRERGIGPKEEWMLGCIGLVGFTFIGLSLWQMVTRPIVHPGGFHEEVDPKTLPNEERGPKRLWRYLQEMEL